MCTLNDTAVRRSLRWAAATIFLALAGCGGADDRQPTAPVHGKVTYKSKVVESGTITFVPDQSGPTASGEIQKDGTFKLTTYDTDDGAVIGSHTVMIISLQDQGDRLPEDRNPLPAPIVPLKFSNNERSGLTATVKAGDNAIDFDLVD